MPLFSRGESRRVGREGAADKLGEQFDCGGVKPGRHEVQGLGKGPPSILAGRTAEKSMLSGLDFLLVMRAEPRLWAVPIRAIQEVGGRQLHLERRVAV